MSLPNGKVTMRFQDQSGNDFVETPFYINANFMSDNPLPNIDRTTAMQRFQQALFNMCSLTEGTYISTKVNYEVDIL